MGAVEKVNSPLRYFTQTIRLGILALKRANHGVNSIVRSLLLKHDIYGKGYMLKDFRSAVENETYGWGHRVEIDFLQSKVDDIHCIKAIRFCFDVDLSPKDCVYVNSAPDNLKFMFGRDPVTEPCPKGKHKVHHGTTTTTTTTPPPSSSSEDEDVSSSDHGSDHDSDHDSDGPHDEI